MDPAPRWRSQIPGVCYNGAIDPVTGDLLPDVAAAIVNRPLEPSR